METTINDNIIYFCVYIYSSEGQSGKYIGIKKFGLSSINFELSVDNEIISNENAGTKIVSSIIIQEYITIFYMNDDGYYYAMHLDLNLNYKNKQDLNRIPSGYSQNGLFFKSSNVNDEYVAFLYFNSLNKIEFDLFKFEPERTSNNFQMKLSQNVNNINFNNDITLNDFTKINDNRLAFISIENNDNKNKFYILLFDLYLQDINNLNLIIRYYNYDLYEHTFENDFSVFVYNEFLVFSSAIKSTDSNGDITMLTKFLSKKLKF